MSPFFRVLSMLLLVGVAQVSVLLAEGVPARLAAGLQDYRNMAGFKSSDEIFIEKSDGKELVYKAFKDDKDTTTEKAFSYFDILYADVPALYESALTTMAEGKYEEALKMLERVKGEKTPKSGNPFTSTHTYLNLYSHKIFLCQMGLGKLDEALKVFDEIFANPSAHARVNVMQEVLPYLVQKGSGNFGLKVVDELEKLKLPRRKMAEIAVNKCLFLSLEGKHSEGRKGLDAVLATYKDMSEMAPKVQEAATTILVYHEKNYREGVKYFTDLMAKSEKIPSWELYQKLAFCYLEQGKWEEARWNYLQAFIFGPSDRNQMEPVILGIQKATENIGAKESDASLVKFLEKVKTTL